jgi:hypothetical protein
MEQSRDAICVLDGEMRFVRASRASEALWGYRLEELTGKSYLDMLLLEDRPIAVAELERLRSAEPAPPSLVTRAVRKDGSVIHVTWSLAWSEADRHWYGIARDDTEHARLDQALEQRAAELRTYAARLATAKSAAEAADRVKSAFLATMSHELRTPLNSIIGFTGVLLQGLAGPLNGEQRTQLSIVRDNARHLLALINDVLDISKIEAGELRLVAEPFDLAAIVHQVSSSLGPLAERKRLALIVRVAEGVGTIVGDACRVKQLLLNLMNNAIKFTERGSVTLEVIPVATPGRGATGAQDGAVRLRVTDTGIGIRPDDLAKIFHPFYQVDAPPGRNHEGTGLGLAICRQLVDLMGGTIEVESRVGEGSTFTVTVPTHAPSARAPA